MVKLTPKQAVKQMCVDCLGLELFNTKKIENCEGNTAKNGACPVYPNRLKGRTSVKTIRKYCLYCQGKSSKSIEECTTETCSFYIYRFGKNPACANRGQRGVNPFPIKRL